MATPDRIVFIIDDDDAVRDAFASLARSVGLSVQTFASAQDFLSCQRPDCAACLVLDVRLPGLSGLDLQRQLSDSGEHMPIIFITGHGDVLMTVRAMKAGAAEFLLKPVREQELLDAIRLALDRDEAARAQRTEVANIRAKFNRLTPREREIVTPVVRGMLNKQVAADLHISEITVKVHRRHIMQKMGARSVPELVRMIDKLFAADSSDDLTYTKV